MRISSNSFCVVLFYVIKALGRCSVVFICFIRGCGCFYLMFAYGVYIALYGVCFCVGWWVLGVKKPGEFAGLFVCCLAWLNVVFNLAR
ncbi:hypothetical protein FGD67_06195 [Colwellia sp. M166]|uniref:hypothetical protein n=1 Tax=Colwellia sp. M166 TaxID=2583805 RepID=UPI00211DFA52|nr:hypothetical protein [Colwellia sp. M166]UUO22821.1 hypothetical protein FGD67_06195 [Colwellia sp. M166]